MWRIEMAMTFSVKQFCKDEDIPEGGMRHLIFHEEENGLTESGAILRVGRNIRIHRERFYRWLDKRNGIDSDSVDSGKEAA